MVCVVFLHLCVQGLLDLVSFACPPPKTFPGSSSLLFPRNVGMDEHSQRERYSQTQFLSFSGSVMKVNLIY